MPGRSEKPYAACASSGACLKRCSAGLRACTNPICGGSSAAKKSRTSTACAVLHPRWECRRTSCSSASRNRRRPHERLPVAAQRPSGRGGKSRVQGRPSVCRERRRRSCRDAGAGGAPLAAFRPLRRQPEYGTIARGRHGASPPFFRRDGGETRLHSAGRCDKIVRILDNCRYTDTGNCWRATWRRLNGWNTTWPN